MKGNSSKYFGILILFLLFFNSCILNVYRPLNYRSINTKRKQTEILKSLYSKDTFVTIRSSSCCNKINISSLVVIHMDNGTTKFKGYYSYGKCKREIIIPSLNWKFLYNSMDSLTMDTLLKPSSIEIINNDTIYTLGSTAEAIWTINLKVNDKSCQWHIMDYERESYKNSIRSRISDYLAKETFNRLDSIEHTKSFKYSHEPLIKFNRTK